jgi:V/A-type H+-transporting ATPase subunit E
MVEKLIDKLIEEAKKKAEEILKKGKKEFEEKLRIEKEKLDNEFEEKLKFEKKKIDSEIEKEIINFRIEKEKEILAIKNKIIDEVIEKVKNKFNLFLNENMEQVIEKVLTNLNEKDIEIFVPEGQKINLKYKVINDKNLKNSFKIKSKLWEIEFSWESIKTIFEGFIKEEASKLLFNE